MADALIFLSAVEYIRHHKLSNCIFVSKNHRDFASPDDKTQLHDDLTDLCGKHPIKYFRLIDQAIDHIQKGLVSAERKMAIEVAQRLEAIIEQLTPVPDFSALAERMAATMDLSALAERMVPPMDLSALAERMAATMDLSALAERMAAAPDFSALAERMAATMDLSALAERMVAAPDFLALNEAILATVRSPRQTKAQMEIAVYVNCRASTATLHSTTCRYYRNRVGDKTTAGHWKKPFSNIEDARTYAHSQAKRKVRNCKVCLPANKS